MSKCKYLEGTEFPSSWCLEFRLGVFQSTPYSFQFEIENYPPRHRHSRLSSLESRRRGVGLLHLRLLLRKDATNPKLKTRFLLVFMEGTIAKKNINQLTVDDEDECSQGSSSTESLLIGFIVANIVGLRHYGGKINGRELVALVREPLNPYDPNAIKVLNTRAIQVGHVERAISAVLAPLIDSNTIFVEGIVPKCRSLDRSFRIPCQIHVFARNEVVPLVRETLSQSVMQFFSDPNPEFALSDAMVLKEKRSERKFGNIDHLFVKAGQNNVKINVLEPPNDIVKSELFLHQKEALGWLVERENSCELPPFWEENDGVFVNVLTNYQTDTIPEPFRGGILADDMGLGKTLTMLSLICITKPRQMNSPIRIQSELIGSASGKRSRGIKSGKNVTGRRKRANFAEEGVSRNIQAKTTLIVCPPSVISTWIDQLEKHTMPGGLKVYLYYGERMQDEYELIKYDVVITTYNTLSSEVSTENSPMKGIEWFRVILDEAHLIKNVRSKQCKAVIDLKSERRWAVTGTPIQNGSYDLFSLMAFLKFHPFSTYPYWKGLVQNHLDRGNESGFLRLQALMETIALRRTKEETLIGLPSRTTETCLIEFSPEENERYLHLESKAKGIVQDFIDNYNVIYNYCNVFAVILHLREVCNDMNLFLGDIQPLIPCYNFEDVSKDPDLLKKMISLLQDGDDFDCPICLSPPTRAIITRCSHIYCQACILKTLKTYNPRCALCRRPLLESDIFMSPPNSQDDTISSPYSFQKNTSSKVIILLKLLKELRTKNPSAKSVIFSQFRKMLLLLEEPMKAAGFKTIRIDGAMNGAKRSQVIKEFEERGSDSPTVLLASLKTAGTGINLTAASQVYFMEPWWNPTVEDQAMDRVHRIGQTEEVKVVRLIMKNSIEERILELQNKRRAEVQDFPSRSEQKQMPTEDVRFLFQI